MQQEFWGKDQKGQSRKPKKTDLAWAAGIVDGEGCIGLYRRESSKKGSWAYKAILSVVNVDPRMPQKLRKIFGVGMVRFQRAPKPNQRTKYHWRVHDHQARSVIALIIPYLVIKREQAELVVAAGQYVCPIGRRRGDQTARLEQMKWIAEQVSDLKWKDYSEQEKTIVE